MPESELLPQIDDVLKQLAISDDIVSKVIGILKGEHDNIQLFYKNAIKDTSNRIAVIERRLDTLYEDRLDGRITTTDYDKYVKKAKAEKEELEYKLVEYTNNDTSFTVTAEYLLELAQNSRSIFQSSQFVQKNKILKALLANAQIDQKRLQLNLLKPFDGLLSAMKSQNWLPLHNSISNLSLEFQVDHSYLKDLAQRLGIHRPALLGATV